MSDNESDYYSDQDQYESDISEEEVSSDEEDLENEILKAMEEEKAMVDTEEPSENIFKMYEREKKDFEKRQKKLLSGIEKTREVSEKSNQYPVGSTIIYKKKGKKIVKKGKIAETLDDFVVVYPKIVVHFPEILKVESFVSDEDEESDENVADVTKKGGKVVILETDELSPLEMYNLKDDDQNPYVPKLFKGQKVRDKNGNVGMVIDYDSDAVLVKFADRQAYFSYVKTQDLVLMPVELDIHVQEPVVEKRTVFEKDIFDIDFQYPKKEDEKLLQAIINSTFDYVYDTLYPLLKKDIVDEDYKKQSFVMYLKEKHYPLKNYYSKVTKGDELDYRLERLEILETKSAMKKLAFEYENVTVPRDVFLKYKKIVDDARMSREYWVIRQVIREYHKEHFLEKNKGKTSEELTELWKQYITSDEAKSGEDEFWNQLSDLLITRMYLLIDLKRDPVGTLIFEKEIENKKMEFLNNLAIEAAEYYKNTEYYNHFLHDFVGIHDPFVSEVTSELVRYSLTAHDGKSRVIDFLRNMLRPVILLKNLQRHAKMFFSKILERKISLLKCLTEPLENYFPEVFTRPFYSYQHLTNQTFMAEEVIEAFLREHVKNIVSKIPGMENAYKKIKRQNYVPTPLRDQTPENIILNYSIRKHNEVKKYLQEPSVREMFLMEMFDYTKSVPEFCKDETGTGILHEKNQSKNGEMGIGKDGNFKMIDEADTVFCMKDGKPLCYSESMLIRNFLKGDFYNPFEQKNFDKEFVINILTKNGLQVPEKLEELLATSHRPQTIGIMLPDHLVKNIVERYPADTSFVTDLLDDDITMYILYLENIKDANIKLKALPTVLLYDKERPALGAYLVKQFRDKNKRSKIQSTGI